MKIDFLPLCFQKALHKATETFIIVVTRNEQGQRLESSSLKNHGHDAVSMDGKVSLF